MISPEINLELAQAVFGNVTGGQAPSELMLGSVSQVRMFVSEMFCGKPVRIVEKTLRTDPHINLTQADFAAQLLATEEIQNRTPRLPTPFGVWTVSRDGATVKRLSAADVGKMAEGDPVFYFEAAIPQSTHLLNVLATLGLSTIQDSHADETALAEKPKFMNKIEEIYGDIMDFLAQIHTLELDSPADSATYKRALENVVFDKLRFKGISESPPAQAIPSHQIEIIRSKMVELCETLASRFSSRLSFVHGDAWASNFFVGENGEIYCIDPSTIGKSDPALDLGFCLADLVFLDVNINAAKHETELFAGEHVFMAERLLSYYEKTAGDGDIRSTISLFIAFKAFVSAVFDASPRSFQQEQLINLAVGVLTSSLDDEEFSFSFNDVANYSHIGAEELSKCELD